MCKSFLCQPTVVVDQDFLGQGKFLETRSFRETFMLQQANKKPYGEKIWFYSPRYS